MPVDVGADRQLVGELDLHLVADVEVDARAGHHAVVGPRLDDLAGADLPVDDGGGELEALGAVGQHLGRERLVAAALGLGREGHDRLDHRLVLRRALARRSCRVAGVLGERPAGRRAAPSPPMVSVVRHPRLGVSGDRAVHLVGCRAQAR